ncbi:MAG: hypothetical protein LQ350_002065 [Teloschistes chrysophthalmus]|nr:MAG: hypothetical protein LQ350_002065 [Niorma chrysophthalma]
MNSSQVPAPQLPAQATVFTVNQAILRKEQDSHFRDRRIIGVYHDLEEAIQKAIERINSPKPGFLWTAKPATKIAKTTQFYVARIEPNGSRLSVYVRQEIVVGETTRPLPDPQIGRLEAQERAPPPAAEEEEEEEEEDSTDVVIIGGVSFSNEQGVRSLREDEYRPYSV